MNKKIIIAITGASGSIYALDLIQKLLQHDYHIDLICTDNAHKVLAIETNCYLPKSDANVYIQEYFGSESISIHDNHNLAAKCASGSYLFSSMVIIPCSMGTLARVAHGISSDLISRTADVCLKESRPLLLVPRETPLNQIHLKNMLQLAEMGVQIVPAMPAFYKKPESIKDLVDHFTGKVLDSLGVSNNQYPRW